MGTLLGYQVYRDNKPVSGIFDTHNGAWTWLLKHQPQSVDHATKYEGYQIRRITDE